MTNPHEDASVSVTIKGDEPGGKFNDPKKPGTWIVFHGSPAAIRSQINDVFGFENDDPKRPLYDLINEATDLFKASATVSTELGGRVLSSGPAASPSEGDSGASGGVSGGNNGDVWAQAAAARASGAGSKPAEEADPILTAIENCKTVAELQQVWAENQSAFNENESYMTAYKARGKSLTTN